MADWKMVYCAESVPEQVVYELVKATYEHQADMVAMNPALADVKPENAGKIAVLYHPGAVKYYNEKGIKLLEPIIKPGM